jgi:hypothetical protein
MSKVITIIDCFVSSDSVRNKLITCLTDLKAAGFDTLLISNTPVDGEILQLTKYYLYDKENRLFEEEYTNIESVDFWKGFEGMVIHDIVPGVQRHGLSVIVNLFHAIDFAKSLGYTHFQRVEVDDLRGSESLAWMKRIPAFCERENSNGLFYVNERNSRLSDISFHYFYADIETFLSITRRINNEDDYRKFIKEIYDNYDFMPVERFLYLNLKLTHGSSLHSMYSERNGTNQMAKDFPDTIWNTETTMSNIPKQFNGCTTKLYKSHYGTGFTVISYNYTKVPKNRLVRVSYKDRVKEISHSLPGLNTWAMNDVESDVVGIVVREDDKIIHVEPVENVVSFVVIG